MNVLMKQKNPPIVEEVDSIRTLTKNSFLKISPFWPLQNMVAVNPLKGFEDMPIEEAFNNAQRYFEQLDLPNEMLLINTETIKWLGVYCEEGQARIQMPLKEEGFYNAWRKLACYDKKIHQNIKTKVGFLKKLPEKPELLIEQCLSILDIKKEDQQEFLTLLLVTLPGWASYIKYKTEWCSGHSGTFLFSQVDYLAVRLAMTVLIWPEAKKILSLKKTTATHEKEILLHTIKKNESSYQEEFLEKIKKQNHQEADAPKAQFVFCIDVRSEPFRKKIESVGDYQTIGFAGFFSVPVKITDKLTGFSYDSCPVILKPKHEVLKRPIKAGYFLKFKKIYALRGSLKKIYRSLKYTFLTPFVLAEIAGPICAVWMGVRTLSPKISSKIISFFNYEEKIEHQLEFDLDNIPFQEKCNYAESALRMMGLTCSFAPVVLICGHGSKTENNAYSSALDCGACGGRRGGGNARIFAAIMNCPKVKEYLSKNGIHIPKGTIFVAAEHNTTTDEVVIFCGEENENIKKIKQDLDKAKELNNVDRMKRLGVKGPQAYHARLRAHDWAQVRPEWGLARNSAFIIAPRSLTASLDLEGRCFLHSYDYQKDKQGVLLKNILMGPMIVAQWINMQYLFSTINNVAYGGGSKITKNIVGKIGVMQGNASDLMNGLPLQSLYESDEKKYHKPQRLMVFVFASKDTVKNIIFSEVSLKKLFENGWVNMVVMDPEDNKIYSLNRGFLWNQIS